MIYEGKAITVQGLEDGIVELRFDLQGESVNKFNQATVADLTAALDADRVRADGAQRSLAAHDASVFDGGIAGPVCFPETTKEVQAIMRIAEQHGSAVVPRGAGTGLAGGAIPLGRPVVVSTGRMNKVLSVDTNNRIAWVQPGVINLDLSKKLRPKG